MVIRENSSRCGVSILELVIVIAIIGTCAALVLPAIQQIRESVRNTHCSNNMKQIGLGIIQQVATTKCYPQISDPIPWTVQIMDSLSDSALKARIEQAIKNQDTYLLKSIGRSPYHLYECPNAGKTNIEPISDLQLGAYAFNLDLCLTPRRSCPDGDSNTILASETYDFRSPWIDGPIRASNSIGSPHSGRLKLLLCSGSVREISSSIDPALLIALGTPDGGEALGEY
jgi:type II secretory pathway pseudopilin PulG